MFPAPSSPLPRANAGAGYTRYFHRDRADMVSMVYDDIPTRNITVEAWVKLVDEHQQEGLAFAYAAQNDESGYFSDNELTLTVLSNKIMIEFKGLAVFSSSDVDIFAGRLAGNWHHLAFTRDVRRGGVGRWGGT